MFDRRERRRRMSTAHYTILGPYLRGSIVLCACLVAFRFLPSSLSLAKFPFFPNYLPVPYVRVHVYREVVDVSVLTAESLP